MGFSSWLRNWTSNRALRRGAQHRPVAPRFHLRLEALEDRCLPSFLTAVTYSAAEARHAVATGDFNGDGKMDVVRQGRRSDWRRFLMILLRALSSVHS
jgi:hypothetical protein